MRLFLLFVGGFSLIVIILTNVAMVLGSAFQPASPALASIDSCTLPCWNDITPGETTLDSALNILSELGYRKHETIARADVVIYYAPENSDWCDVLLGFSERRFPSIVIYMNLLNCPGLRMGDLAGVLGDIEGVVVEWQWGWGPSYRRNSVRLMSWRKLSVEADEFFISLVAPNDRLRLPWHGFITLRRYCHFQPNICRRRSW